MIKPEKETIYVQGIDRDFFWGGGVGRASFWNSISQISQKNPRAKRIRGQMLHSYVLRLTTFKIRNTKKEILLANNGRERAQRGLSKEFG